MRILWLFSISKEDEFFAEESVKVDFVLVEDDDFDLLEDDTTSFKQRMCGLSSASTLLKDVKYGAR